MFDSYSLNLWAVIFGAGAAQGLFLAVVLFTSTKGSRTANRLLALLLFLFAYYLADIFLGLTGALQTWPHLVYLAVPIWYLFAPLSYFYVKYLLDEPPKWNFLQLLHLIPFAIMMYRLVPFYVLSPEVKLMYLNGELPAPGGTLLNYLIAIMNPVQGMLYFGYILAILRRQVSAVTHAHLSWLKIFFSLMMLYSILFFLSMTYWYYFREPILIMERAPLLIFSIILYMVGYMAINQPSKLFPPSIPLLSKPNGTTINSDDARKYAELLRTMMETEKPFLDSDLKYSVLATRLGIAVRQLSEVLNREIGQSFNDFVNSYRVREVQERFQSGASEHHTILAIGLDSGFSSKASFNRIFKKHTGMTPSQYIAQTQADSK